jgi:hypothetical protein
MRILNTAFFVAAFACLSAFPIQAQSKVSKCDPSLDLVHTPYMNAKGRLQEAGAPQTKHIVALGNKAIPILIACITDETRTKEPIVDYWPVTTVGDIAFFYLCDLFTDSSWDHSTINGVVNWKTLQDEYPGSAAFTAWHEFVKKHGRRYVQAEWIKKWKEVQSSVFWDAKEQCFKIGRSATQGSAQ